MTKKKIGIIAGIAAAVLILACVAVWFFFFREAAMPSDPNEIAYVNTVSDITQEGGLGMTTKFSGVAEPEKTLSVQKDDTKKIAELHVAVGQEVKTGDPLFSYDTEDISLQLQEAELQLESLGNRITTLNQQIESLEKEKSNAPSDDQLSYTLQIQSTQLEIRTAEYDRSTKAKEIEQLKESLENADVLAEMDGVVKEIRDSSSQTDYSGEGTNAYITILSTGQYRIKATATELNIQSLYEGMPVKVTSRVDPSVTWAGKIDTIEREPVSNTQNNYISYGNEDTFTPASKYNFYVLLDSFDGLMLGQHVYVEPDLGDSLVKTGLWLPGYYIFTEGSKSYVWAADSRNRIEKREVSLGQYDGDMDEYEILSGLDKDDRIAVPGDNMHSGMYAADPGTVLPEGGAGEGMDGAGDSDMIVDGTAPDGGTMPAEDGMTDGADSTDGMDGAADSGMVVSDETGGTADADADAGAVAVPESNDAVIGGAVE